MKMYLMNSKSDVPDCIKINVPLILRLMEYSKESEDVDLHIIAENLVDLMKKHKGRVLSMKDYYDII
jgi:hypothetical protein